MRRAHTGGPIIAGLAFAVAWLPCTGPTLGAILTAASQESTVGRGGVLLAFYSLGLAVPFILSALAFTTFSGVFRFFRNHYAAITLVSGRDPDRDGRAALHERADAAELRGAAGDGRPGPELLQQPLAPRADRATSAPAPRPRAGRAPARARASSSTADRDPHVLVAALLGGPDHPAVAVEGGEVLGGLRGVRRDPVRRAPLAGVADLAGQLEQPLHQRARRRVEAAPSSRAGRPRAPAAPAPRPPCAGSTRSARARTARSRRGCPATARAPARGRGRASCRGCAGAGTSARRRRRCRRAGRRACTIAPCALRHLHALAALGEVDELHDHDLEALGVAAERLPGGLHPQDVAVVVGAPDVDRAVVAAPRSCRRGRRCRTRSRSTRRSSGAARGPCRRRARSCAARAAPSCS